MSQFAKEAETKRLVCPRLEQFPPEAEKQAQSGGNQAHQGVEAEVSRDDDYSGKARIRALFEAIQASMNEESET